MFSRWVQVIVMVAGWVGVTCAGQLAEYSFTNTLAATTVDSAVTASAATVDGNISMTVSNQPVYQFSSLTIKDNDLTTDGTTTDSSIDDAVHHGLTFTLTPAVSGEFITITNVALRFYNGATNVTWTAGVFAKAGSGSEVKLGEASFLGMATPAAEDQHWFFFHESTLTAAADETVTLRLDFADNNGLGANFTLYLDTVQVYGSTAAGGSGGGSDPITALLCSFGAQSMVLDWPAGAGWQLQSRTNLLTGEWQPVSGAAPPFSIGLGVLQSASYYRLLKAALPDVAYDVFGDSLSTGWINNSFSATVNVSNTSPVQNGTKSMAVTLTGVAGAAQLSYTPLAGFDASAYQAISFWIHGGAAGGQRLELWAISGEGSTVFWEIPPLRAGTWVQYIVPLSLLGVGNATDLSAIRFRDHNVGAQPVFYVDDIRFVGTQALYAASHMVYDDMLRNGWFNNPINTTLTLTNTSPVARGSYSIVVDTLAWGAVQMAHPVTAVDTTPYRSLSFKVHGGVAGGQKLTVGGMCGSVEGARQPVPALPANTWLEYAVALEDLNAANATNFNGIRIWENGGQAGRYYLDDIQLSTQEVPSVVGSVYLDGIQSGWFNNPFGCTVNLSSTGAVYRGAYSMGCTITAGGGTAQINWNGGGGGFSTVPYESLSFWVNGGTAGGQRLTVSLAKNSVQGPAYTLPALPTNSWVKHIIPLSTLGAASVANVTAVWIRDANIGAQPLFYLDDIRFERPTTVSVTYDGNGSTSGSVPVDSDDYVAGASVTVLGNTGGLSRSGAYVFNGWNAAANGGGTHYDAGDSFVIPGNTTLYAEWLYTGVWHTVTYDGNGATGGSVPVDASNPYESGETVTVAGNTGYLTKAGALFAGWNTASNGSGSAYSASNTFAITTSRTLYAQWTPSALNYTVTYMANGATGGTAPVDGSSPYPINSFVAVKEGGTLVQSGTPVWKWNTKADGTGADYYPGTGFVIASNMNLYARYGTFEYKYAPYNQGLMDPQLTGWPISAAESNYVLLAESTRRPGAESNKHLPAYWPITPAAGNWGGPEWLNTHALLTGKVLSTPNAEILLVGDSITSQWGGGQMGAFGTVWSTYYGSYPTVNLGIGGDKTQNVLWRLDHGRLDAISPKVCVLQIGNNNMYFAPETGIDAAVDGIVWCLRNLRHKYPDTPVILVNVFPIEASPDNTFFKNLKRTHDALNALRLDEADPMVHMLDLWDQMIIEDGTGNPDLFYDGTHPNEAGYTLWATNMLPLVEALVP